jgi:hypothetical protein
MKNDLKRSILFTVVLAFLVTPIVAQTGTSYTVRDFESWNSATLEFKPNKKWELSFEEQLRLKDNAGAVDQFFSEFNVTRKLPKDFSIGYGLRYIRENDDKGKVQGYENHLRWNADLAYKHKIDRFTMKYRLSYQSKNELGISEAEGDILAKTIRLKIGADYNIRKWKLDPEFSSEIFRDLGSFGDFSKFRLTLGTNYKFKNAGELGVFYRMEKQLNVVYPKTTNILGFQYKFTIKKKKNEK